MHMLPLLKTLIWLRIVPNEMLYSSREIERVWEANNEVYGIRKVWHQLQREKFTIARCTVARLMKRLDIHGVIRGKGKENDRAG